MNSKTLIAVLSIGIIVLSILNYRNKKHFESEESKLNTYKNSLKEKTFFLENALNYSLKIDRSMLTNIPEEKDIIIYYSDGSCSICVDDFLKTYKNNPNIRDRIIVISDEIDKDGLTVNFNDAFNANYSHKVDTVDYFKEEVFDVLFIKRKGDEIESLLTYSYNLKEKEYFLEFAPSEFKITTK
jgi:hypothetical protein